MPGHEQLTAPLEQEIDRWRSYLQRRQAIHQVDVAELEDHLREQVASLMESGLGGDEAFLVAVKRMGDLDSLSREFAREHSDRLWKHLVLAPSSTGEEVATAKTDSRVAFALAAVAALAIKLPDFFGIRMGDNETFYLRNLTFFILPVLTGYFVWKRRLPASITRWLVAAFVAAAVLMNSYPLIAEAHTMVLSAIHLPIALWLVVGVAYAGGRWNESTGRMDFVRFSGELFIYYVLIALGGGVLTGFMAMIFQSIGIDIEPIFERWLLPCGAMGGVMVAAWLVEAKQSVIENMAPVLTRLFSPLFTAVLIVFLGTLAWTGRGINIERDMLIAFDLLLVVVLALMLYSISARDPAARPGTFDIVQVVLVVSALIVDLVALSAIGARIGEYGLTPNRVAALGMNIVLLVNLAWSTVLYIRFLRGSGTFAALEQWQTSYLPVYAAWAAIVVIVFPPLFGFV